MTVYDRAKAAADYISSEITEVPDTAIVLGSGLGLFSKYIEDKLTVPYGDIPGFPVSTVPGHKGELVCGKINGKKILTMNGRFHLYEGYGTEDVTLYVRVFALLGIKTIIFTNAAGAINASFKPGDLMLIEDHLSFQCPSPLAGKNDDRFGTRFPPMEDAYSKKLREMALSAADELRIDLKKGVYAYTKGPMFETPAEIRALKIMGADACGMSTVPEVTVAVHCGISVLGISCLTNMAAGISKVPLSHKEVIETGKLTEKKFTDLLSKICEKL